MEYANKFELLNAGLDAARPGAALEFGVGSGGTLRVIAAKRPGQTYGFDSFKGLPETWRPGFPKGMFACDPPEIDGAKLVKGLFKNTVKADNLPKEIGFVHLDCDLYSSTKYVLDALPGLKSGTIIQFDEFYNYNGWIEHEFKAFVEWVGKNSVTPEPFGYVPSDEQISFRIL